MAWATPVGVTPKRGGAGADERIRTADLHITNALLYQLSYVGMPATGEAEDGV